MLCAFAFALNTLTHFVIQYKIEQKLHVVEYYGPGPASRVRQKGFSM
jgi:hypothetical protein